MVAAISWSLPDGLLDLIGYTGTHSRVGFYPQDGTVQISDGHSTWAGNEFVHGVFFQHPAVVTATGDNEDCWWVADTTCHTLRLYPRTEAIQVLTERRAPSNVIDLTRFRALRAKAGLYYPVLPASRQERPRDLFDSIIATLNLNLA